eukprot:5461607-Prymnesium_polylepis.2
MLERDCGHDRTIDRGAHAGDTSAVDHRRRARGQPEEESIPAGEAAAPPAADKPIVIGVRAVPCVRRAVLSTCMRESVCVCVCVCGPFF